MDPVKEQAQHFLTGCYICPETKQEVTLESDVPRAWVKWPVRVASCQACGHEHVLEYDDVRHCDPIFGHE